MCTDTPLTLHDEPSQAEDLQLRQCIIFRTCPSSHRAVQATLSAILSQCRWEVMPADVNTFMRACINCISTSIAKKISWTFGTSVHDTRTTDFLQFYFLDVGPEHDRNRYILTLSDHHTAYMSLFAFEGTSRLYAAQAVID